MKSIDINCDVGEASTQEQEQVEAALLPLVTSVNIACGFHAGSPASIRRTIELATRYGCTIGAHPSLADREGFGRRRQTIDAGQLQYLLCYQIGAIADVAQLCNADIAHIKLHGALYSMANEEVDLAHALLELLAKIYPNLCLYAPPRGHIIELAAQYGIKIVREGFIDRGYQDDGSLVPRSAANALLPSVEAMAEQAFLLATKGIATSVSGQSISLPVETICLHSDTPNALLVAAKVKERLQKAGAVVAKRYLLPSTLYVTSEE